VGQDFHPPFTIIPSDLAVREAAKPVKRRASEDDIAARPQKKTMPVFIPFVREIEASPLTRTTLGRQDAGGQPTGDSGVD
jgi:hypothetical protein